MITGSLLQNNDGSNGGESGSLLLGHLIEEAWKEEAYGDKLL